MGNKCQKITENVELQIDINQIVFFHNWYVLLPSEVHRYPPPQPYCRVVCYNRSKIYCAFYYIYIFLAVNSPVIQPICKLCYFFGHSTSILQERFIHIRCFKPDVAKSSVELNYAFSSIRQ